MNVLSVPAAERECHRSVALANQIRPDAGSNDSARPEQERLAPNDLLCFETTYSSCTPPFDSFQLQYCDALRQSLCHQGRTARGTKTTQTTIIAFTFRRPRYCTECLCQRSRRLFQRRPGTIRRRSRRKKTPRSTPKVSTLSCSWHLSTLACSWFPWYVTCFALPFV